MKKKPSGRPSSSEPTIRDIKRKTRWQYSAEEKDTAGLIGGADVGSKSGTTVKDILPSPCVNPLVI